MFCWLWRQWLPRAVSLGDTVRNISDSNPNGIPCSGLINMYMKDSTNDLEEE